MSREPELIPQLTWEVMIPSGSRAAIRFAEQEGCRWIDASVGRTADGVLYVGGPYYFPRGTTMGPDGPTWSELQRATRDSVDSSWRHRHEPFLTLDEFLALCKSKLRVRLAGDLARLKEASANVFAARMEREVLFFVHDSGGDLAKVRKALGATAHLEIRWTGDSDDINRQIREGSPNVISLAPFMTDNVEPTQAQVSDWRRRGIRVLLDATFFPDRPKSSDRQWLRTTILPDIVRTNEELSWLGHFFRSSDRRPPNAPADGNQPPIGRVQICFHRGASRYAPENSMRAFALAASLGADYVELDVRTTADGVPILMHDATLNRTTKGSGKVKEKTFEDIRALIIGEGFDPRHQETIVTLDRFLASCDRSLKLYVDAKDIAPEALIEALKKHGRLEDAVVYQSREYLTRLKRIEPSIKVMPPLSHPEEIDGLARQLKPFAVDARWRILSKDLIDRCHALGIKVFSDALGLNERPEEYRKAVAMGIDGIQTDFPVRVYRALAP